MDLTVGTMYISRESVIVMYEQIPLFLGLHLKKRRFRVGYREALGSFKIACWLWFVAEPRRSTGRVLDKAIMCAESPILHCV